MRAALGQLLLAFEGETLPDATAGWLRAGAAGVTLFRAPNVRSPDQVRSLTDTIQRLAPDDFPLLIAIDQEGGQLIGLGGASTPFIGNMALGAVGDPALAERVGRAIGTELRAAGINVNYAPVADLATNPANPALGIRSFGDDPMAAGLLVAAMVRGLRSAGVAATLKHFPGKGEAGRDTHHELAVIANDRARLDAVELAPFVAGLEAGAELVMSSHAAYPSLTGDPRLPATLSSTILGDLLRGALDFEGLVISDALNMHALAQGSAQLIEAVTALRAGVDLLLLTPDDPLEALAPAVERAALRGLTEPAPALRRIAALRRAVAGPAPDPSVIGSAAHLAVARELAERAVTLVRDDAGLLPLRPDGDATIGVVMPRPADLTPADTSSTVPPGLAGAVRRRHARVSEHLVPTDPSDAEIAVVRAAVRECDLLLVGTVSASLAPSQGRLVEALLDLPIPMVTVALRTPWDHLTYPATATHACTYSILPPALEALVDALWGSIEFCGRLPVRLAAN